MIILLPVLVDVQIGVAIVELIVLVVIVLLIVVVVLMIVVVQQIVVEQIHLQEEKMLFHIEHELLKTDDVYDIV
jgi:hypothetical protein